MDGGKKGLPAGRNSTCRYVKVGNQSGLCLACRCVGRKWLQFPRGPLVQALKGNLLVGSFLACSLTCLC